MEVVFTETNSHQYTVQILKSFIFMHYMACNKQGRIQGGKGVVPLPRPVKGGLRAITLFKSETVVEWRALTN